MSVLKRIQKQINILRPVALQMARAARTKRLKGATIDAVIAAVESAVAKQDLPILEAIAGQVEDYEHRMPERVLVNGERVKPVHGLVRWLHLLQQGDASLPDRIPRAVLLAWRDAYSPMFGLDGSPWCPLPLWRCADCKMVLPHCPGWSGPCPVCTSNRIFFSDLSRCLGVGWIDDRAEPAA